MDSEKRFTKILEDLFFYFWIYIFVEFEIRNWIISEHDFQFKTPERNIIIYFEFWIQLSLNLFWKSFCKCHTDVGNKTELSTWLENCSCPRVVTNNDIACDQRMQQLKKLSINDKGDFNTISSLSQFKLSCTNTLFNSLIHRLKSFLFGFFKTEILKNSW